MRTQCLFFRVFYSTLTKFIGWHIFNVRSYPPGLPTRSFTPYLLVAGVPTLIEFLKNALKAEIKECINAPDGTIMHAQGKIGDSFIMMVDPREGCESPHSSLYLYVLGTDAVYQKAISNGATSVMEPAATSTGIAAPV